ncbi:MAG: gliding motility-associated protein GldE [Bacteroidales bacterium]|nr:gliding motility-associated protein GldE [Bacteroidales bacterium]MCF8402674.1 gliding motility-associated protein GldE [Bacteroidales bacterium]
MANVFTGHFSPGILIGFLVVLVLLIFSAMISGSETAFFSFNPSQLKDFRAKGSRTNNTILTLLERPKRLLATILITNNFVNVAIVIISSYLSSQIFNFSSSPIIGFIVEVVIITTIILLFGEIMPKIYANYNPVIFATFMVQPLFILTKVFYPIASVLVQTTSFIDRKMGNKNQQISMQELSDAIDITVDENSPEQETKILKGIVRFTEIEAKEIMKSRLDAVSIEAGSTFRDVINVVNESNYSRIPVYTETFDNIIGILYVKDLLPHIDQKENFDWKSLVRPAFYVPENKKINDLLQEIQEKKIHMAIVVDEYGGTSGIVTLEDIIEEIVGEISDEFDSFLDDVEYTKIDDFHYVFQGKTSINDFCKIIDIDDVIFDEVKGDADSLAGLILEILGRMPERNTIVRYLNYEFKVLSVDHRRIKKVNVTIHKK